MLITKLKGLQPWIKLSKIFQDAGLNVNTMQSRLINESKIKDKMEALRLLAELKRRADELYKICGLLPEEIGIFKIQTDVLECMKAIIEANQDPVWMDTDSAVHETLFERLWSVYIDLGGDEKTLQKEFPEFSDKEGNQ